jgi:hypothetical protein
MIVIRLIDFKAWYIVNVETYISQNVYITRMLSHEWKYNV